MMSAEHTETQVDQRDHSFTGTAPPARHRSWETRLSRVAAAAAYVFPGFFISLLAFTVLVPMFSFSLGTLVIWIGAVVLPATLTIASWFAQLTRTRLAAWGLKTGAPSYTERGSGILSWMSRMLDPQRWLDLVTETLVAFPLRILTFVIALTWTSIALGGTTFFIWGGFLPDRLVTVGARQGTSLPEFLLEVFSGGRVAPEFAQSFGVEAVGYLILGVVFLVTLPGMLRMLARCDAAIMVACLGDGNGAPPAAAGVPRVGSANSSAGSAVSADSTASSVRNSGSASVETRVSWIAALLIAIAGVAVTWPLLSAVSGLPVVVAMLFALASAAAVVCAVRWPSIAITLQTVVAGGVAVSVLAVGAGLPLGPWPWPVQQLIMQALIVFLIAARFPWPIALVSWGAPQLVVLAIMIVTHAGGVGNAIVSAAVSLGALACGLAIAVLVRSRGALRAERLAHASVGAERAELAERNRIAQEMHDVVAHSMSVISVQATTAKYRLPEVGGEAEAEFASIAESSRRALSEMRGLLQILRAPEQEHALAPQPTVGDLPALMAATSQSGVALTFVASRDGVAGALEDIPPLPAATGLTVFRIVQEGLSNAVRHAPGAAIAVTVDVTEAAVTVAVANGPAAAHTEHPAAPGAGLGLTGVRDRAAALGGTAAGETTPDGGFLLTAQLPIG